MKDRMALMEELLIEESKAQRALYLDRMNAAAQAMREKDQTIMDDPAGYERRLKKLRNYAH